jgi:hypothetical protein
MLVTADQLILHAFGDYVTQSDWMATEKTKRSVAAVVHAIVYTLPFFFLQPSWQALTFIAGTHFIIDRWRLARYVVWAKNWLAPWSVCPGIDASVTVVGIQTSGCRNLQSHFAHPVAPTPPWAECQATGYPPDRPIWLAFWLMIIVDNLMHVCCNAVALKWL